MAQKKTIESKDTNIIFDGVLTYNRVETTDYKGRVLATPVNKLSVKADLIADVRKKVIDAGVDVSNPFCPKWIRDDSCEYVNLKSKFDIPTKLDSIADATQKDVNVGAKIKIKMVVKSNGNIYPVSIKVIENGAEYNPFDGM